MLCLRKLQIFQSLKTPKNTILKKKPKICTCTPSHIVYNVIKQYQYLKIKLWVNIYALKNKTQVFINDQCG